MPLYDTQCTCGFEGEVYLSLSIDLEKWRGVCDQCGRKELRRVFRNAPATKIGGKDSAREINAMKRSFDQRFVKSGEMDQVRHKHGSTFDESLAAGATRRLTGGQKTHWDKD